MSLSQALSIAMSGLRANQLGLSLTSANVANSDTPGYIRKTINQILLPTTGANAVKSRSTKARLKLLVKDRKAFH